jgi:tRNA threonylcarbamoyladenosine biosynthesis protein TsaB
MITLAFDTATPATAVALCGVAGQSEPLHAREEPGPGQRPGHATRLMPLAVELLSRAGIDWADVERIAVGVGPGTFTGLRIGIATARALAQARGIPLVGVSTLQSLALGPPAADGTVLAVIDARRGEAFAAAWRSGAVMGAAEQVLLHERVVGPEALGALVDELPLPVLAAGDGALAFRKVLELHGASVPQDDSELHRVTAVNHCELARNLYGEPPEQVVPHYMRVPDAELTRRAAQGK